MQIANQHITKSKDSLLRRLIDLIIIVMLVTLSGLLVFKFSPSNLFKVFFIVIILLDNWRYLTKENIMHFMLFSVIAIRANLSNSFDINISFVYSVLSVLVVLSVFLIPKERKFELLGKMKTLLAVVVGIGLVFHIMQLVGIYRPSPLFIMAAETGRQWIVYPTQVYSLLRTGIDSTRFMSFFNEPGTLGLVALFILAIDRYRLKDWQAIVIFIGGLFTLSLSFYFLSAVYIGFEYLRDITARERNMVIVPIILFLLLMLAVFPFIQEYLGGRLVYVEGEGFEDKRANVFQLKEYFTYLFDLTPGQLMMGGNFEEADNLGLGHVSWVQFIYRMGLIVSFYWLLLSGYFLRKNKGNWVFILVFILLINHRPVVVTAFHFFMMSMALTNVEYDDQKRVHANQAASYVR